VDGGVPFADAGRSSRDLRPVGDVARLGLGAELAGDPLQPLEASGEEDTAPAARRQEARRRGADAARATGYDGDANRRRVLRLMSTVSSIGSAYPPANVRHTGTPARTSVSRTSPSRAARPSFVSESRPRRSPP
jgi:hypothetical protein